MLELGGTGQINGGHGANMITPSNLQHRQQVQMSYQQPASGLGNPLASSKQGSF